ncbi:MAG: hypothetical protein QF704_02890 [Anaerolineales bacterium]|jgi:hypothetical protein|nr:hypothetical protein [Anaerolineales bacterium]
MFELLNLVLGISTVGWLVLAFSIKEPYEYDDKGGKEPYPHEHFRELKDYKKIVGWIWVVTSVLFLIMFGQEMQR